MANNPGFSKCDYPDSQQPSCPTQNPPSYFSSQSNGNNFPQQMQQQHQQQSMYPMAPTHNGYYPPPAPAPSTNTVVNVSTQSAAPNIIVVGGGGGCPSCRTGVLRKSHCTFCGIFWSIVLFPIGLFCLCCCTKYRCTKCSYSQ